MINRNEDIYDEQIHPLINQIADVCRKYGIPFIAHFQIDEYDTPAEDGPNFVTAMYSLDDMAEHLKEMMEQAVQSRPSPWLATLRQVLHEQEKHDCLSVCKEKHGHI